MVADSHLQSESRPATVSPLSVPQTPKTGFIDASDRQNSIQWAEKTLSEKRNMLRKRFTDEENSLEETKPKEAQQQPVKVPLSPILDESSIMSTSMMVEEHFANATKDEEEAKQENSTLPLLVASSPSPRSVQTMEEEDGATEEEEEEEGNNTNSIMEDKEEEFANIEFDEDELISHYYSTESLLNNSSGSLIPVAHSQVEFDANDSCSVNDSYCYGEELLFDTACLIDSKHHHNPENNFNHWFLMWMRKTYHAKRDMLFPIFSHLFAMILGYYCRDVLTSLSVSKTTMPTASTVVVATTSAGQQSEKV